MILFWTSMLVAQAGAFIIFKDLADISQWVVQSNRKFTMAIWYNRYPISAVSIVALLIALFAWWRQPEVCHGALLGVLVFIFVLNFVSGMFNPKWMFRSQQHKARFVPVAEAPQYMQRSLQLARDGGTATAAMSGRELLQAIIDNRLDSIDQNLLRAGLPRRRCRRRGCATPCCAAAARASPHYPLPTPCAGTIAITRSGLPLP